MGRYLNPKEQFAAIYTWKPFSQDSYLGPVQPT